MRLTRDFGESRMREIRTSGSTRGRESGGHWFCASHSVLPSLLYWILGFVPRRGADLFSCVSPLSRLDLPGAATSPAFADSSEISAGGDLMQ